MFARKITLSLLAATAMSFAGAAYAADVYTPPPEAPAYVPEAPVNYFQGFYLGLHGGYGWGTASAAYNDDFFNEGCGPDEGWGCAISLDPAGAFVGGQVGFNAVVGGGLMLGVEGDYSFASIHDSGESSFQYNPPGPNNTRTSYTHVDFDVDQMASIRGRLGWVMGQWMPFITGGWGWANATRTAYNPDTLPTPYTETKWLSGWTAGAGLSYAINQHWTITGEYRYQALGNSTFYGNANQDNAFADGTNIGLNLQTVRFGVNLGF